MKLEAGTMGEKRGLPRVAENYGGFDIWYDP